jgi:hypothetical protein
LTVGSAMCRAAAISAFDRPRATSSRIARSRSLNSASRESSVPRSRRRRRPPGSPPAAPPARRVGRVIEPDRGVVPADEQCGPRQLTVPHTRVRKLETLRTPCPLRFAVARGVLPFVEIQHSERGQLLLVQGERDLPSSVGACFHSRTGSGPPRPLVAAHAAGPCPFRGRSGSLPEAVSGSKVLRLPVGPGAAAPRFSGPTDCPGRVRAVGEALGARKGNSE